VKALAPVEVGRLMTDGWLLGFRLLARHPILGLKRLLLPVSYWRTAEFAYVHRQLSTLVAGQSVLDLGSPKELAFSLGRRTEATIWATDILASAVRQANAYAGAIRPGRIQSELQDGRLLSYSTDTFDAAYSVSVLEHIPDDGDSKAIAELVRVVRPGGLIVGTVPFALEYRETHVRGTVYERAQEGDGLVFYQRHYDWDALHSRVLAVRGATLEHLALWGETLFGFERLLRRRRFAGVLMAPLEPLLALFGLRELDRQAKAKAMAAFFVLRKQH
jgi:SAM-dependent methyltransferase